MSRALLILIVACLLPVSAEASVKKAPASFSAAQTLTAASSSPGNAYVAGASVVVTAPVNGDLSACAGSIVTAAPVAGDNLILSGSISLRAPVGGDVRAAGGTIEINRSVGGDLFAVGFSVRDAARVEGNTFIVAANTTLADGASGPVLVYGNNISLSGEFDGDVTLVAIGHISLAPDIVIHGKLSYEAPESISIPATAIIDGGVVYKSTSYLPDPGTSHMLAFMSVWFFIIARIVGALILAGLLAGLFPLFARTIIDRVTAARPRSLSLTFLLGFGVLVATPVIIALLSLTFVGLGVAVLVTVLYVLFLILAFVYAGIMLGSLVARWIIGRTNVLWHDGVTGMVMFSLVALIPYIGLPILFLLTFFALGTLLQVTFSFAFPHEHYDAETE